MTKSVLGFTSLMEARAKSGGFLPFEPSTRTELYLSDGPSTKAELCLRKGGRQRLLDNNLLYDMAIS